MTRQAAVSYSRPEPRRARPRPSLTRPQLARPALVEAASPAARLISDGPRALSDAEVLSVLLQPASKGPAPTSRAVRLLRQHSGSLLALGTVPGPSAFGPPPFSRELHDRLIVQAALEFARRSLAQTLAEQPVIDSPSALRAYLALWLGERHRECFAVLFLNAQNRLISAEEMFQGGLSQTFVYPREIAKKALELRATSIIIAHNHPSGAVEPSAADQHLTQGIASALRVFDIGLVDHIIVAGNRSFSFADRGLI